MKVNHIEINIGKSCNHKCLFCMSGITKNKVLGFEKSNDLKAEIVNFKKGGYISIGFLGGEPTIHPNFLELIDFAKKTGFESIEVISNASMFHDEKFLTEAISNGLTRISLSIHSHLDEIEAVLTGGISGVLDTKIKALNLILKYYNLGILKKELSVNMVISKINYTFLKNSILFLYKLGVKSFRLNFIQLEGYSTRNYAILALSYERFQPHLLDILSLCNKYNDLRINFEAVPWCFSGLKYVDFLKYSEQNIDRLKDKVSRDDIDLVSREIVNQLKRRRELKGYLGKCEKCFLKKDCEGIWRRQIDYFKLQ